MKNIINYCKWLLKVTLIANILIVPAVLIANFFGYCIKIGIPESVTNQTCADYGGPLINILLINFAVILLLILRPIFKELSS